MNTENPSNLGKTDALTTRGATPAHTWPRLYTTQSLAAGNDILLGKEQSHYLFNVLRAHEGDSIRLFNGQDGDWQAILSAAKKNACVLTCHQRLTPQKPEPDLWLCCAPIKRAHFDFMIMKATELGVAKILPILTARTQIREVNLTRATAIAIEAAEQSERLTVPEILPIQHLKGLMATWEPNRTLFYCAEHGAAVPLFNALTLKETEKKPSAAILTGPEGGLTKEELILLQESPGAQAVRLGPRILRADTAALAALSCWQAISGDWL